MEIVTLIFYQLFGKNAQLNAKVIIRVFHYVFIYELVDLFFTERSNIKKREIIAIRPIRKKKPIGSFP